MLQVPTYKFVLGCAMDDLMQKLIDNHPAVFKGEWPRGPSWLPAGWYPLCHDLCAEIERELTMEELEHLQVTQVKEKWGSLHFYCSGPRDHDIDLVVRRAEEASESICMVCGEQGKKYKDGWHRVMCAAHERRRRDGR